MICIQNTYSFALGHFSRIKTQKAGNLKRHMRNVHEGRKDFECNMCNKKFKQLQSLKGTVNTIRTVCILVLLIFLTSDPALLFMIWTFPSLEFSTP